MRSRSAGGDEPLEEVVDLGVVGHQHLHPGTVSELELSRCEARPGASGAPLSAEVDGIAGPHVLPAGDGMGHVVQCHSVDGVPWHPSTLVPNGRRCRDEREASQARQL